MMNCYRALCLIALTLFAVGYHFTDAAEVDCWDYKSFVMKTKDCCLHNEEDDEDDEIMKEGLSEHALHCVKKYTADASPALSRESVLDKIACITECAMNGTKALTVDMKLNSDLFLHYYDDKDDVEAWKTLWKTSVKTCLEKTADRIGENMKCKSGLMYFLPCLWEETTANCPAELLDSKREECTRVKYYVDKCSIFKTL